MNVNKENTVILAIVYSWFDVAGALWEEIAADLISPWTVLTPHNDIEFYDLTWIDTTTNFVKLTRIFENSSNHIATCFKHTWLSWYPKPM